MAATKKSAKRSAGKKPVPAKKKRTKSKKAARGRASTLERRARKSLGVARDGFDSVLEAGGKTWRTLKNTTALMVEGVKETLSGEPEAEARPRRRR
jgi:hypothetical protein